MAELFSGKVVVITGASSGIGKSTTEAFLQAGASVVLFARNEEELRRIAQSAPERTLVVTGDVTQKADRERLVKSTLERFGQVDILVPNAGIARVVPFEESTEEKVMEQFSVNFMGAVQTVREFLPVMQAGSSVIFITTFLTQVGFPGLSVYSASKAALKSMTQTLGAELAPRKIRVNAVAPGPINTPLWGTVGLEPETLQSVAAGINQRLMPGQFGVPEDIANAIVFLASDQARNIYGQELVVDGGYTLG